MVRAIERHIASLERRLVLLAPSNTALPVAFNNVEVEPEAHDRLVFQMQRLRGHVYLHEGNVKPYQLSTDGRHVTAEDRQSWHLLMADEEQRITSCAWLLVRPNTVSFSDLRVRTCPLLDLDQWRDKVTGAVTAEIARARRDGLQYAELGGWAISKERRCTPDGLLMALATYALSQLVGGALGITTANVAHSCSAILRRMGGSYFEFDGVTIPSYFDPKYNTDIDLLKFDSRRPSPRYTSLIDIVRKKLGEVAVIAKGFEQAEPYSIPDSVVAPVAAA